MTVGQRIHELRRQKGLRLVDLAKASGVSPSSISQVERMEINPSLPTLTRIANALGVPPGYFFEEPHRQERLNSNESGVNGAGKGRVVSPGKRKILSPSRGVTYQLLTPDLSGKIEFVLAEFEPGSSTADEPYSHAGEECALILEGELTIEIAGEEYLLKEGDSITFQAESLHRIVNKTDRKVVAIWVNSPPWF